MLKGDDESWSAGKLRLTVVVVVVVVVVAS